MSERLYLTHGCSLSNLPLFVAVGSGLLAEEGLEVDAPPFEAMGATAEDLASGRAPMGTAAFSQPLLDAGHEDPPVVVAGSGLRGVSLLAQPGVEAVQDLVGRVVGTFRADPLELLLHDALAAAGLSLRDVAVEELDSQWHAVEGFRSGRLTGLTVIEPFAGRLRHEGAVELSDGVELWGERFPDTVLVAKRAFLAERPETVARVIRAMLRAQSLIERDPRSALVHARPYFPGFADTELEEGLRRQPTEVDLRPLLAQLPQRWSGLQSLGLASAGTCFPAQAVSLELLEGEISKRAHRYPSSPDSPTTDGGKVTGDNASSGTSRAISPSTETNEGKVMASDDPRTTTRSAGGSYGRAGPPNRISRRDFMGRGAALGAVATIPAWLLSACGAVGAGGVGEAGLVRMTHGTGLCNLGIFVANERKLAEPSVKIEFVNAPNISDISTLFGAGQVAASVIPYTNFLTLVSQGAPVRIASGAGVEGCVLAAGEGIESAEDLRGKSIGTFQADTLEMVAYDYLKRAGMSFDDVQMKYLDTSPELAQAFIAGEIDAMSHIEPYATQGVKARRGATVLSNGTDIYGKEYSDCVLATSDELFEQRPQEVKALIKALMLAQRQSEEDLAAAAKLATGKYYKTDYSSVLDAASKQKQKVDQRDQPKLILNSARNLQELDYIQEVPGREIFDFSLLEEVIAENSELYESLELS